MSSVPVAIPSGGKLTPIQAFGSLLDPARTLKRLRTHLDWAINDHGVWAEQFKFPLREEEAYRQITRARDLVDASPKCEVLLAAQEQFKAAASVQATPPQVTMIMSVALDAFPTARVTSLETYVEAIVLAAEFDEEAVPISPAALALAMVRLLQRQSFTPTIAEVLAEGKKA